MAIELWRQDKEKKDFANKIYNIMVSYNFSGKGAKTIVLLHGFLENRTIWNFLVKDEKLHNQYRFLQIDYLGHGTAPSAKDYANGFEAVAVQIEKLLQKENIKAAAFIGHSMGGYLALACLASFSEMITGLCLYHSTANADSNPKKADRLRAVEILKKDPAKFIFTTIPGLFNPSRKEELADEISKMKTEAGKTEPESAIASVLAMRNRPDRSSLIKQYADKIFYIGGTADPLFSREQVNAETAHLPADHVFLLPKSGHMSFIEDPAKAKDVFQQILKRI